MSKNLTNPQICKLDNENQLKYKYGKISKSEYEKTKKYLHGMWSKQNKEAQMLKKLMKTKASKTSSDKKRGK